MGGHAQKLETLFSKYPKDHVKIVKSSHPAVIQFLSDGLFDKIKAAELELFQSWTDFGAA